MAPSGDADEEDDDRAWWQRSDPEPPSVGPDVPEVDIPEVEIPGSEEPFGEDVDVDAEVARGFWRLVLIFDVALLALALGPMFVYFQSDLRRGGTLFGFGVLVFLYGVVRYREFKAEGETREEQGEDVEESEADRSEASETRAETEGTRE